MAKKTTSADSTKGLSREEVDSLLEERLAAAKEEWNQERERDISAVRSQYDRTRNAEREEFEQTLSSLEQRLHEAETRGLSDDERLKYENRRYSEEVGSYQSEISQLRSELEAQRTVNEYVQGMVEGFGIDPREVDYSDPDRAMQTAWEGALNRMSTLSDENKGYKSQLTELNERLSALESGATTDVGAGSEDDATNDVVTTEDGGPLGVASIDDLQRSVSKRFGYGDKMMPWDQFSTIIRNPQQFGIDVNDILPALAEAEEALEE